MYVSKFEEATELNFKANLHLNGYGVTLFENKLLNNSAIKQALTRNPKTDIYVNIVRKYVGDADVSKYNARKIYKIYLTKADNFAQRVLSVLGLKKSYPLSEEYKSFKNTNIAIDENLTNEFLEKELKL